jgi:hypothetical protein
MRTKIYFSKGDFYKQGSVSPIFENDGTTEFYFHLFKDLEIFEEENLKFIRVNNIPKLKKEIITFRKVFKELKKQCGEITLPFTKTKIKNVQI